MIYQSCWHNPENHERLKRHPWKQYLPGCSAHDAFALILPFDLVELEVDESGYITSYWQDFSDTIIY